MSSDKHLRHECAVNLTETIVSIFCGVLRPEEFQDAMDEVYETVRAGLLRYELKRDPIHKRLKPSIN
jgi:hypothetical protein